jgi:hypothetical protein
VARVIDVGSFLLDFSYARPPLSVAMASGCEGFFRYSAGQASRPSNASYDLNKGKLITPTEFDQILGHGADIVANSEWYTTRVTEGVTAPGEDGEELPDVEVFGLEALFLRAIKDLGGGDTRRVGADDLVAYMADAGSLDGEADAELWDRCGLNHGSSIYVSWDAAPSSGKYNAVAAYLRNHDRAMDGMFHTDLYAGTPALREMFRRELIRYGWRPNAGSWSDDGIPYQYDTSTADSRRRLVNLALTSTPAAILQTGNYWFGTSADENLVLRPEFGSHLQNASKPKPPPPPPPTPVDPDPEADLNEDQTRTVARQEIVAAVRALMGGTEDDYFTSDRFPNWVKPPTGDAAVGGLRAWMGKVGRKLGIDW